MFDTLVITSRSRKEKISTFLFSWFGNPVHLLERVNHDFYELHAFWLRVRSDCKLFHCRLSCAGIPHPSCFDNAVIHLMLPFLSLSPPSVHQPSSDLFSKDGRKFSLLPLPPPSKKESCVVGLRLTRRFEIVVWTFRNHQFFFLWKIGGGKSKKGILGKSEILIEILSFPHARGRRKFRHSKHSTRSLWNPHAVRI